MAHDDQRCGRRAAGHDLACHVTQLHVHRVHAWWQHRPGAPLPVHTERLAVVQPEAALCRRQRIVPCARHAVASFSIAHQIGAAAWPLALVLMALLEVATRIAIVQLRGRHAMHADAAAIPAAA